MRNMDVMQVKSPTTKIIGIFASMTAIVTLITVSMNGTALADPLHCDRPGWPSCYDGIGLECAIAIRCSRTEPSTRRSEGVKKR
jgi:hypothetical protein